MNKMKKKIFLLAIAALIFTLFIISDTYGLFETNAMSLNNLDIGVWQIFVNNVDVTTSETITLNDFTYSTSLHTENGYFAPGMDCYFDVVIDMSLTDVSVLYELEIDDTEIYEFPNIYFSILDVDTNQELDTNSYSGTSLLSDNSRIKTLRVYLNWDNDEEYDESDSSLINGDFSFTISANFLQYLGE